MLEWLIVGGGIHGTYLSLALTAQGGVPPDRIRVLDPHETPLARWEACTSNTGMAFLRSPFVHHLDLEPFALRAFARSREGRPHKGFAWPYSRPALGLFRAHTSAVIARHGLRALRIAGTATDLATCSGGIRIETAQGSLETRRVLLALGAGDRPAWPPWARALRSEGALVDHVFDVGFSRETMPLWSKALVLGGGITAAQTAVAMARRAPGTVTLLARHPPKIHQFDSDPGWMGPLHLDAYSKVADLVERRRLIQGARHRGSMPSDVASQLRQAIQSGAIVSRTAAVMGAEREASGFRIDLDDGKGSIRADRLVLATGFEKSRPGGELVDRAIAALGLACGGCGYPIVDRSLRWHPGIHVTGPLAELELGPPARNILGARMAAERLLGAA